jgi:2-(1,2-epoxy-1,2-dihydrophenyl)acetyl-CoA isomerase
MDYRNILFDIQNGIARVTLNRPTKLNSFNVEMHLELRDAIERTKADPAARALLLTGAGRAFCAGQDLGDRTVSGGEIDLGASIELYYAPLVRSLRALPIPVVCAVNGVAAGAGAQLALACDIVIAAKSASFIEPFCKLGLVPDTGGTYFLPRLAGTARAMAISMLGEKIPAEQAASWGLIWRSVEDTDLIGTAEGIAAQLATGPTKGLAATKHAIYASAGNSFDQQLDLERDLMRDLGKSHDYQEGVAAFLEKRAARFEGK